MERKAVGVVECAEDDPDGLVAAFLCEHLVQEDEALLRYTFARYRGIRVF